MSTIDTIYWDRLWLGSTSAAFSSPLYVPPREESVRSGEERGLLSWTAAGEHSLWSKCSKVAVGLSIV